MVTAGLTGPSLADEEVVNCVLAGDTAMFEILMRRHNQRLYRVARAILRDDAEAEDLIQDTYVRAYQHLSQFEGRAKFSTWLTRIAVNEALARKHRFSLHKELEPMSEHEGEKMDRFASTAPTPGHKPMRSQATACSSDTSMPTRRQMNDAPSSTRCSGAKSPASHPSAP